MKRILKITGIIFILIIVALLSAYLYSTDFGRKGILSKEPRTPGIEIPVSYNIGWWAHQDDLIIDSLKIKIIESNLSLFNSKSLVSYKVSGRINYQGHWKPRIKEVHVSERLERDSVQKIIGRIIELTPIVSVEEDNKVNSGVEKFEFKNEQTIASNGWELNLIKFVCGKKEQIIQLRQKK